MRLSGSELGPLGVSPTGHSNIPILTPTLVCRSVISGEESEFAVEEHFHPRSTEYFTILKGTVYFTLDGEERIVREGERDFIIPRGVVHTIRSPRGQHAEFKVRGDHDPVGERDFLMRMFTLVETVSRRKLCLWVAGVG